MEDEYVHGYSEIESDRLVDQANTLANLLHNDTVYSAGSKVLEAGCGVGAQTLMLATNSPDAQIKSVDISEESVNRAKLLLKQHGVSNVEFEVADIFNLPFEAETFDHIFVCFVLEHLKDPVGALEGLRRVLKMGGSITVIEGDHGSCYFYPKTKEAVKAWECLVKCQTGLDCNPMIGREIYPLLKNSGFKNIEVSPKIVYVDSSNPELVEGFNKKTIIAMVEGVKDQAISSGMIDLETWEKGIKDLYKTTEPDGVFFYNFFKGIGIK
ncbi:Methyltransferase type 11 [Methanobacterium lacus]|uniref:Methyltransferase type 11 n=1 Tax=Methanobacterium lacus (strain AL-21) TaxID=877455 RepID=F0T9U8_METLA|nr:class I SAM-dependent methyltransferase [Methanobacterium lacus]ADZ09977.1 Methyltransferase type 11 [Methanobacterium lacus]